MTVRRSELCCRWEKVLDLRQAAVYSHPNLHCTVTRLCVQPWAEPLQPEHGHLFSCACVSLQSLLFPDILKTSPDPPCPEDYPGLKR